MSDRVDTEAVRRLADAATEGPWDWADGGSFGGWWLSKGGDPAEPTIAATLYGVIKGTQVGGSWDNLRFIAAARTLVPALCDELDRTREALRIAAEHQALTTDPHEVPWLIDLWLTAARAALAEVDTERCPTCGETAEWDWIAAPCPDQWHRATDTEGGR